MENQKKRLSILKTRQPLEILDETNALGQAGPGDSVTTTTRDRRVSFHNVKHVRQYHRDHGNLIDASPLREKITDTMDSDGILTPRGRQLDASQLGENATINVFEKQNGTMDMSLASENAGNETMKMFEVTTHEKTVTTVTERIVERHVFGIPKNTAADDTLALFNMTNNEEKDMTIDQSTVFAVPRLPEPKSASNQSMQMDVDESHVPQDSEKSPARGVLHQSMDISVASVQKSPARQRVPETNNETLAMFASPARGVLNESMDISMVPESKSPAREAILGPTGINETLALFQSPAPVRQNQTASMILDTPKRVFEEDPSDVDMEITQVGCQEEEELPRVVNQSMLNQSMDISIVPPVNETMKMFESPARIKTIPVEPFNESVEMETDDVVPANDPEPEQGSEQSPLMAEEERAQVQSSMMMDMSSIQESLVDGSALKTFQETDDTVTEKSLHESLGESMQIQSPQQKTMQIEQDTTITRMSEPLEETMENVKSFQEETFVKDTSVSMNSSSVRNTTVPMSARRRSLIRDCSSRGAVLESPRRVAIENSIVSMNAANMTALVEHRRRKSIQLNSNQKDLSNLNESVANMSAGRDIFALNTSVRSPMPSAASTDPAFSFHIAPESPATFLMPNFDPAVTNVVWLTPAENEDVPPPEAAEFARLVAAEKLKAQNEIEKALLDGKLDPKKIVSRGKMSSKLTDDEKEVVLIARQDAEIRFLELRRDFAAQTRQKYDLKIRELETENARIAEQIREFEQLEELKKEVEAMRNRPTYADYEKIRAEWKAAKKEMFEMRMEALRSAQETLVSLEEEKMALLVDIEERQERLAQMEDRAQREKAEMKKILEGMMSSF